MKCNECKTEYMRRSDVEIFAALQDQTIKRLWIAVIILIALLFVTNLSWIVYESQFEDVTTTEIEAEQETTDGGNNYIVGGDMVGEAESKIQENDNQTAQNGR